MTKHFDVYQKTGKYLLDLHYETEQFNVPKIITLLKDAYKNKRSYVFQVLNGWQRENVIPSRTFNSILYELKRDVSQPKLSIVYRRGLSNPFCGDIMLHFYQEDKSFYLYIFMTEEKFKEFVIKHKLEIKDFYKEWENKYYESKW